MHVLQQGFYVFLPEIKQSFNLSPVQTGAMESARSVSSGVVNFPAGFVGDLLRSRWFLLVALSLGGIAAAYLLISVAPNYSVLLVGAALIGVMVALWHPPALSVLSSEMASRRGLALSIHGMGGNLGNAIAPLAIGGLFALLTWQRVAQIVSIPVLVCAVVLWVVLRNVRREEGESLTLKSYMPAVKGLLKNKTLIGLVMSRSVLRMGSTATMTFFPIYCREDLGFSTFNIYLFLLMGSGTISLPFLGIFSDRFGRKVVLFPSIVLLGACSLWLFWAEPGIGMGFAVIGVGLFIYAISSVFQAAAMDVTRAEAGATTIGFLTGTGFIFVTISPIVAGILSTNFGNAAVFLYAGSLAFASAAILLPIHLQRSNPQIV
jgi:MFS family permease